MDTEYASKTRYIALEVSEANADALAAWGYIRELSGMSDGLIVVYDKTSTLVSSVLSPTEFDAQFEQVAVV